MGRLRRIAAPLAALAGLGLGAPALACSPAPGYRVPSSLELVAQADAIAIGLVASGPDLRAVATDRTHAPPVMFELEYVMKNGTEQNRIEVEWAALIDAPEGASDPDELMLAHPDAYAGACVRTIFVRHGHVLLFLKRDARGRMRIMDLPFARVAEDVAGRDGRWTRAVGEYLVIARLPRDQWKDALAARRADLLKQVDDPDALAIAEDMRRQIEGETHEEYLAALDRQDAAHERFLAVMNAEMPDMEP